MKWEYKHNPQYFKRRILEYVNDTNGDQLMNSEIKWLALIKYEELEVKYYNKKKTNFGNTRGCTKSYVWNQGLTKAECDEYRELRRNKLFCLLSEKPKRGMIFKPVNHFKCIWCTKDFFTKFERKFCSPRCSSKYGNSFIKGTKMPHRSHPAWNKGLHDPNGSLNGKKSAHKQSATVTGRKMAIREDGTCYWIYPNKN